MVLTAAIHAYVAEKVGHLEELAERVLAAHVVLILDEKKNPKQSFCVKVHLALPGPDLYAQAVGGDLYAAIDDVVAKLARQVRKRKTKLVDKKKADYQRKVERRKRG
jgi:putative sigma-54 modulation protein